MTVKRGVWNMGGFTTIDIASFHQQIYSTNPLSKFYNITIIHTVCHHFETFR